MDMKITREFFRAGILEAISKGSGATETLLEITGEIFCDEVTNSMLVKSFIRNELNKALAHLREQGEIETVGRHWKTVAEIDGNDAAVVSARRARRIKGELTAEVAFAHDHGMVEEAVIASNMLAIIVRRLEEVEREKVVAD